MRLLLILSIVLAATGAQAQVDTLRLDTSGDKPVLYLRDHSLHPGTSQASTSESLAVVRQGPEPIQASSSPPARRSSRFPTFGILWIVAIGAAILSTLFVSLEARRRNRTRREMWKDSAKRSETRGGA
ncbi:MAG: hypothetical protein AAF170_19140 [Bacteroidota bacterium]